MTRRIPVNSRIKDNPHLHKCLAIYRLRQEARRAPDAGHRATVEVQFAYGVQRKFASSTHLCPRTGAPPSTIAELTSGVVCQRKSAVPNRTLQRLRHSRAPGFRDRVLSPNSVWRAPRWTSPQDLGSLRDGFGAFSSLPPLARNFSARRPEKARLIHPRPDFPGQFNQQHLCQ